MPEEYINEWPPYSPQDMKRKECAILAARLMVNAAMTAPIAGGVAQIEIHLVHGQDEQEKIARKMEELAYEVENKKLRRMFKYEAVMVRESDAVIFIGNYRARETPFDADCGMCGGVLKCSYMYTSHPSKLGLIDTTDRRTDKLINGPLCTIRVDDLGYAVGSALWLASQIFVDARPFLTVGIAGQKLGYCPNSEIVIGILVASQAKSPYVDIHPLYHLINLRKIVDYTRKQYVISRLVTYDYRIWEPSEMEEIEEETEEMEEE